MKTVIQIIMIPCLLVILTNCVSVATANLQRKSEKEVEVYSTKIPSKEYVEIKYIQVEGSVFTSAEKLLKTLSQRAKREGADAIINVQYAYSVYTPYVWGIAIKYKDNLTVNKVK